MELPFTPEQFLNVFVRYNLAVFPAQVVWYLLAGMAVYLTIKQPSWADKAINLILALLWLWMGLVYQLGFFSTINKAAYVFGGLFLLHGGLLLWKGVFQGQLTYRLKRDSAGAAGILLIAFALVGYPLTGHFLGRVYPANPTFGLPCPTTIFTFGMFLLADRKVPLLYIGIPLIWSVIGFTAALSLGIHEDISLLVAALLAVGLILRKNIRFKKEAT